MNQATKFNSFKQFWPFYLGEHRRAGSRYLHYFGTISANLLLVFLLLQQYWLWLPSVLLVGYLPAWIGHFVIEKNRPATFRHPLWSLMGDYKMLFMAITGKLEQEFNRK